MCIRDSLKAMDALPPALSDITVNVPGHTYLPEEYVPDADERVLWYRRIASAATEQAVEDVRADLADKRPDMPQAAKNLLEKARIKAYANEHHIKTVSVTAGKLVEMCIRDRRSHSAGVTLFTPLSVVWALSSTAMVKRNGSPQ